MLLYLVLTSVICYFVWSKVKAHFIFEWRDFFLKKQGWKKNRHVSIQSSPMTVKLQENFRLCHDPDENNMAAPCEGSRCWSNWRRSRWQSRVLSLQATWNENMDTVGEEEPEPITLKSIKNNKTFTVPRNDRVREGASTQRQWRQTA